MYSPIVQHWMKLLAQDERFHNKWKCNEVMVRSLRSKYYKLYGDPTCRLSRDNFNAAVDRSFLKGTMNNLLTPNSFGIFKWTLCQPCPYSDNKTRIVSLFYFCNPSEALKETPFTYEWKHMSYEDTPLVNQSEKDAVSSEKRKRGDKIANVALATMKVACSKSSKQNKNKVSKKKQKDSEGNAALQSTIASLVIPATATAGKIDPT